MAKGGKKKGEVENRAIYSRVSFLQQAAVYLASSSLEETPCRGPRLESARAMISKDIGSQSNQHGALYSMARRLTTDMRAVSLKMRIRLSPAVKHTVCKYCDSVLIDGDTCTASVENKSKNGRKPWADMLVRKCHTCGKEKRYPVQAPRPKRRPHRDINGPAEPHAHHRQPEEGHGVEPQSGAHPQSKNG
ncbi:Rpr2-domain-containing protein [Thozetella sp. PMI_491]|nr:Rpr2-domain-containing protein [Thozetella sp. PMI_491]